MTYPKRKARIFVAKSVGSTALLLKELGFLKGMNSF
tara:strand:+ start:583 stop:690 length:108 start_codon:yes stop_codon:yes gene_type:complete